MVPALKKRLKISVPTKVGAPAATVPSGKIRLPALPVVEAAPSPSPSQRSTGVRPPPPPPPSQPKAEPIKKEVAFAPKAKPKASPVKKPKPLHPAQANGMSMDDYKGSKSALKKLLANKHARIFAQPVDPVRDNAPK